MYKEDWLGLKSLDARKGLVFLEAEGRHVIDPLILLIEELTGRCTFPRNS